MQGLFPRMPGRHRAYVISQSWIGRAQLCSSAYFEAAREWVLDLARQIVGQPDQNVQVQSRIRLHYRAARPIPDQVRDDVAARRLLRGRLCRSTRGHKRALRAIPDQVRDDVAARQPPTAEVVWERRPRRDWGWVQFPILETAGTKADRRRIVKRIESRSCRLNVFLNSENQVQVNGDDLVELVLLRRNGARYEKLDVIVPDAQSQAA